MDASTSIKILSYNKNFSPYGFVYGERSGFSDEGWAWFQDTIIATKMKQPEAAALLIATLKDRPLFARLSASPAREERVAKQVIRAVDPDVVALQEIDPIHDAVITDATHRQGAAVMNEAEYDDKELEGLLTRGVSVHCSDRLQGLVTTGRTTGFDRVDANKRSRRAAAWMDVITPEGMHVRVASIHLSGYFAGADKADPKFLAKYAEVKKELLHYIDGVPRDDNVDAVVFIGDFNQCATTDDGIGSKGGNTLETHAETFAKHGFIEHPGVEHYKTRFDAKFPEGRKMDRAFLWANPNSPWKYQSMVTRALSDLMPAEELAKLSDHLPILTEVKFSKN